MTAPNEYEPSAEAVEALKEDLVGVCGRFPAFRDIAAFVLRRQHEREEAVIQPSRRQMDLPRPCEHCLSVARDTLAAHAKLDAPKVPTLLEAAKAHVEAASRCCTGDAVTYAALKAAVEREEREKR